MMMQNILPNTYGIYSVNRLLAGPAIGAVIVLLMGLEGDTAKALILSCAVPTP